jgi:hypothetical protein
MDHLMKEFRRLDWGDHNDNPICDEILAAALRLAKFDLRAAADELWKAKYPNPIKMAVPWTTEQRRIADTYMRDEEGRDGGWDGYTDPAVVPLQVEALRELGLPGFRGVPFSDATLVGMLRSAFYDVHWTAEHLLAASGIYPPDTCRPLTGKAAEIEGLRSDCRRLSW